jgi:hypothetical protein
MDRIAHHQDTVIHAETGCGKTMAYLVPLLSRVDPGVPLQLLILLPSRELALQVASDVHRLVSPESPLSVALVVGGAGSAGAGPSSDTLHARRELAQAVSANRAEVLVATPQALSRVLHTGRPAASLLSSLSWHGGARPARDELQGGRSRARLAVGRAQANLDGDDDALGDGDSCGDGARLLVELATNLDAIVLDEVDALLPPPLLKSNVGYYRQRDWARADRGRRRAARVGGAASSPVAALIERLLSAVDTVEEDARAAAVGPPVGVRRRMERPTDERTHVRRRQRDRRIHLVAASATVGRGVLLQLRRLFRIQEGPPAVVGTDGEVRRVPHGMRDAPFRTSAREGKRGRTTASDAQPLGGLPAGRVHGLRGVAGVGVPTAIDHFVLTVDNGAEKASAVAEALGHLRPRSALVVLPNNAPVGRWVEELRAEGLTEAKLLHEAFGFPTRKQGARGAGVRTSDLLETIGRLRLSHPRVSEAASALPSADDDAPSTSSVLITTESSVRGIDLPQLDCVALLYVPSTSDAYLHLAGRTGRRETSGTALSVLDGAEARQLGLFSSQLRVSIRPMRFALSYDANERNASN